MHREPAYPFVLISLIAAGIILAAILLRTHDERACTALGGAFVRADNWYRCVQPMEPTR